MLPMAEPSWCSFCLCDQPGEHKLEISYMDDEIGGSPFKVHARKTGPTKTLSQTNCVSLSPAASYGFWQKDKWVAAPREFGGCEFPWTRSSTAANRLSAQKCLKQKHVLFVGDSLVRCQYHAFATWLATGLSFDLIDLEGIPNVPPQHERKKQKGHFSVCGLEEHNVLVRCNVPA